MVSPFHHRESDEMPAKETRGSVWNWARRYDLLIGFVTGGREQAFRRRIADLVQLHPGEAVLDVGCGTGSLALEARQRVGKTGRVSGIDPSAQMIARARSKAARRSLSLDFQVGVIEQLTFSDQTFDVVLSTFMMHHLPDDLKRQGLAEIARVLKPGGRLLILDFTGPAGPWHSRIQDQPRFLKEVDLSQIETGKLTFPGLSFVRAQKSPTEEGKATL